MIMKSWFDSERMICTDCQVVMNDSEPFSPGGEWFHPQNGCKNQNKYLNRKKYTPLQTFKRKKIRRALRRGSKMARKYRP